MHRKTTGSTSEAGQAAGRMKGGPLVSVWSVIGCATTTQNRAFAKRALGRPALGTDHLTTLANGHAKIPGPICDRNTEKQIEIDVTRFTNSSSAGGCIS